MTDSMKFGPEWLRNMSAEPAAVSSSNNSVAAGSGSSSLSLHSLGIGAGGGSVANSRNMFPEYRYGREEMLSLFDRNCLVPQILPSFKRLFVEKVQFPLALTPSSEDELNTQTQAGSNSRSSWLQRSPGGFGPASRGSGRGGTVERGRMRGKSIYHPMYQRPNALYDDSLSSISIKPERNWSERNGSGGDLSSTVGPAPSSGAVGGSGIAGGDWNGTPSSSPRKDFLGHHNRNLENWRRNRNEDGSCEGGSAPSGSGSGVVGMTEAVGWRSGGHQRWGRSTSWRDEEQIAVGNVDVGTNFGAVTNNNMQRSISMIGTAGSAERSKATASGIVIGPAARQMSTKWQGSGGNTGDGDENLPEWAMENPSEMGGTFDSSGAFHGEIFDSEMQLENNNIRANIAMPQEHISDGNDATRDKLLTTTNSKTEGDSNEATTNASIKSVCKNNINIIAETRTINNNNNSSKNKNSTAGDQAALEKKDELTTNSTAAAAVVHGDISERFQAVADEVEKLIMDDEPDSRDTAATSSYEMPLNLINEQHHLIRQQPQQHSETAAGKGILGDLTHKTILPFTDQLAMQQHHHLQQQQQQHLAAVLPPHVINAKMNDLWFYRDPQSNVQGPFSAIEMTEWYRAGYFNEVLYVRRFSDTCFRPLGELIKLCHGNMPFTHSHLLPTPIELDNLQQQQQPQHHPHPHHRQPDLNNIDEQLKANVTAAADSLSAAIKNNLGTTTAHAAIDTSHMLTMRFQLLQEQYMQHQEYLILSELTKNEGFQRMDAAQRESYLRSKVQLLTLPDYLSSFSGLSSTLAAVNPQAGNQLNDAIAQQAKKDQRQTFPGSGVGQGLAGGNFIDANDFILNAQLMHQQQQSQQEQQHQTQSEQFGNTDTDTLNKINNDDLLNEYNLRMLLRGNNQQQQQQQTQMQPIKPIVDFMTESQLQNRMVPMWQHQQTWPNAKVTLWDVASLEEEQSQQMLLKQQQLRNTFNSSSTTNHLEFAAALQQQELPEDQAATATNLMQAQQQEHQNLAPVTVTDHGTPQHREPQQQQQHEAAIDNKPSTTKQHQLPIKQQPQQQGGKLDEERRKELVEEKRRLKDERKRQQQEEDKRRALQAEEERNQQQQEEKDRQQQIQAQRRKALLANNSNTQSTASYVSTAVAGSGNTTKSTNGIKMEQQSINRSHGASIAPWTFQAPSVNNVAAPGLAEIQKAERRERRADQQRQQEQLDKQMRATAAAAAEANDALLKWQASPAPAPVLSLADIQAEEAKRLAAESIELQRRREQEQQLQQQHQQSTLTAASLNVTSGFSNIWGSNNKAWSGSGAASAAVVNTVGNLWDDTTPAQTPLKYNTTTTAASVLASGLTTKPQSQVKSAANITSPRNLRKSQTMPTMQTKIGRASLTGQTNQQQQEKPKINTNKTILKVASGTKTQLQNVVGAASSNKKVSEYENEFTTWCTKSLDNMSAKVDVPTFVAFLQDLEAPYEVKDYVRIYLGDGKESTDFAKQFLERRSKYKSLQRAQNAHNDDMCKPAPAITPSSNDNGDGKSKQKKIKKNKMTKMDARILGFSVTAAEGRINVGGRDYVDGP